MLLGRALSPSHSGRAAAPTSAGAARTLAGVPVAFPRTADGAALAVASYQRAFASTAILRPAVLRSRIEVVATPDYAPTMLAVNSPGARRLASGPIGAGVRRGLGTVYSAVPIGYRVESYRPGRARILTWGFTLLGNAASVEPAAYFGVTHTEVVWLDGRWRIAETRGGFGPTPKPTTARANVVCDVGGTAGIAITGAIVGGGNPVSDVCNEVSDAVGGVVKNPVTDALKGIGNGIFEQITGWVSEGAAWLIGEIVEGIEETTTPQLTAKSFVDQYAKMAMIATLLGMAMLLLAVIEGVAQGNSAMLVRVVLVNLPLGFIATKRRSPPRSAPPPRRCRRGRGRASPARPSPRSR